MIKIIHPCDVPTWSGKKYPMFCEIKFEDGNLSITGVIGPTIHGNAMGGCGQIDIEFNHYNKAHNDSRCENPILASSLRFAPGWNKAMWYLFLEYWHDWHLNDMHSECIHQEQAGITYQNDPDNICLECGYKIGSAWTHRDVPSWVIQFLFSLPDTDRVPNWV